MSAPARWATGVAHVTAANGPKITVLCPHCGGSHTHPRNFTGSRHVIAGCHAGPGRLREYAIAGGSGAGR